MPLIDRLERRFGRWGIPGLIRIVCGFTALNYLLLLLNPPMEQLLYLDWGKVLKGEVWRMFTFILVPPYQGLLGFVFFIFFQWFAGESLERAWGSFRFTAFYLGAVLGAVAFLFLLHRILPPEFGGAPEVVRAYNAISTKMVMEVLICAFACVFPEQEIRLFGIIPVKLKWIGLVAGGFAILLALDDPLGSYYSTIALLFVFAGFLMTFAPVYFRHVRQRATVVERRRTYRARSRPEEQPLHECHLCHVTEFDDPDADFRVSDGVEYCLPCLEKKKGETVNG